MTAIVSAANVAVASVAGGAFVATKTGGSDGAADASAVSATGIAGDLLLRVRPLGTGLCYVGVSANPLAGSDAASIQRGAQINGSTCRLSESGVLRPGSFALSTFIWIRRSGGLVQTLTGPDLATAVLKRSIADSGAPLFFDSSLLTMGLAIEVKIGSPAAFSAARPRRRLTLGIGI